MDILPAADVAAYLNTGYRFGQGGEVVTLRIDTRSAALQWLHLAPQVPPREEAGTIPTWQSQSNP